jgi:hypothetical protein
MRPLLFRLLGRAVVCMLPPLHQSLDELYAYSIQLEQGVGKLSNVIHLRKGGWGP